MNNPLLTGLLTAAALATGVVIGYLFGAIQNAALNRNKTLKETGKLKSGWAIMPGSFGRIAILLVVLVLVQAGLPMFFHDNIQWIVSAGLILGYGWTLLKKLRERSTYQA